MERLSDAAFANERHPDHAWLLDGDGLPWLVVRVQIPSRRLVPARRALERHPSLLEVQKRIMPVETAEEVSDLVGNH